MIIIDRNGEEIEDFPRRCQQDYEKYKIMRTRDHENNCSVGSTGHVSCKSNPFIEQYLKNINYKYSIL